MRPLAAAVLALSVGSVACGGESRTTSRTTFDGGRQPATVSVGSEFDLALKSNQSTGYRWILVDSAALGPLRFVSKDYTIPPEYRDNNGAGGTERWTFRATAAGDGVVVLAYKGPGETSPTADSVRFRVTVR